MLYRKILPLCLLILCLPILAARADGETGAAEADAANDAAEAASHTFLTVDGLSDGCSAADCAAFLRGECDAALVQTVAAATESDATDRIATSLLNLSIGRPVYGRLAFTECSEVPMMTDGYVLELGSNYNFHGNVTSGAPITSVTITIDREERKGSLYPFISTVTFAPEDNITRYDINSVPEGAKKSLNDLTKLNKLRVGEHYLVITATSTEETEPVELVRASFTIERQRWNQLAQTNFSDNYSQILGFFGDPEKFLFRYRWRGNGRGIILDPEWRNTYLVPGRFGSIHRDAEPYFLKAQQYIDTEYVRVSGNKHDSGVIPLSKLVLHNSGTCVARFISSRKYVSHHSFGTVVDLNTNLSPNRQRVRNKNIIYDAVYNHLIYEGIKTDESGVQYYDFTYTGKYKNAVLDIPPEIVNYLLYELAFYRAGFRWGFYFDRADAMHFTLTESRREYFETGPYAMRKVFTYINE